MSNSPLSHSHLSTNPFGPNILGDSWRQIKRRIANTGSTNPITPGATEPSPVHMTAAKLEVQTLLAPASTLEQAAAHIAKPQMPATQKAESKQQGDALNAWEDEGGATTGGIRKAKSLFK